MKTLAKYASIAVAFAPFLASAQIPTTIDTLWSGVVMKAFRWFVIIFFLFATYQFLMAGWEYLSGKGENADEVKNRLLYGAVGVAVGLLAFVLPTIVANFLGGSVSPNLLPVMPTQ